MAYPRRHLTEGESIVSEFRPHWKMLAIPVGWIVLGIAVVVAAWLVAPDNAAVDWITTGVVVVLLVPLAFTPLVQWWFTWYVLTNERLITRTGVLSRSGIEIPLENINNVLFSQTVFERILQSGDLLIESAGETGQSRFSNIPHPEEFQSTLYRTREARTHALQQSPGGGTGGTDGPAADATDRLAKLAELHRQGVISDEEYEEKRRKLVDEI